jgi:hypothetical protein
MILDVGLAVRLVVSVRSHAAQTHGCPEWEGPGVQAALIATEGAPGIVLAAALIAAEDATLRLPSAGAFRAHWPKNATATPPPPSHNVPCPDHPEHDMPCQHVVHRGDMTPEQIREHIALALTAAAANPYVRPEVRRARAQEAQR